MISNFCDHILTFCHHHNELIAQTALDVMSTLSHSNIASVDRVLIEFRFINFIVINAF